MEPWMWDAAHQSAWERRKKRLPQCVCCGDPLWTEKYLDLSAFGLEGYACEACMEENTGYSQHLEDGSSF